MFAFNFPRIKKVSIPHIFNFSLALLPRLQKSKVKKKNTRIKGLLPASHEHRASAANIDIGDTDGYDATELYIKLMCVTPGTPCYAIKHHGKGLQFAVPREIMKSQSDKWLY